mmetsp:Transcript_11545/g.37952  ORF Transcript_11545/g.37952 Transcript_11545/m.37952 type:complete len:230 (-) Transcript_11545:352-1041(-)
MAVEVALASPALVSQGRLAGLLEHLPVDHRQKVQEAVHARHRRFVPGLGAEVPVAEADVLRLRLAALAVALLDRQPVPELPLLRRLSDGAFLPPQGAAALRDEARGAFQDELPGVGPEAVVLPRDGVDRVPHADEAMPIAVVRDDDAFAFRAEPPLGLAAETVEGQVVLRGRLLLLLLGCRRRGAAPLGGGGGGGPVLMMMMMMVSVFSVVAAACDADADAAAAEEVDG